MHSYYIHSERVVFLTGFPEQGCEMGEGEGEVVGVGRWCGGAVNDRLHRIHMLWYWCNQIRLLSWFKLILNETTQWFNVFHKIVLHGVNLVLYYSEKGDLGVNFRNKYLIMHFKMQELLVVFRMTLFTINLAAVRRTWCHSGTLWRHDTVHGVIVFPQQRNPHCCQKKTPAKSKFSWYLSNVIYNKCSINSECHVFQI